MVSTFRFNLLGSKKGVEDKTRPIHCKTQKSCLLTTNWVVGFFQVSVIHLSTICMNETPQNQKPRPRPEINCATIRFSFFSFKKN